MRNIVSSSSTYLFSLHYSPRSSGIFTRLQFCSSLRWRGDVDSVADSDCGTVVSCDRWVFTSLPIGQLKNHKTLLAADGLLWRD